MRAITVRVRQLIHAHQAGLITLEERDAELLILGHRWEMQHPIPIEEAVRRLGEIARANSCSTLREESDVAASAVGMVRPGDRGDRVRVQG